MSRPPLTVSGAFEAECQVDSLCRECGHLARLDLARLSADGHGDVTLISLPFRCDCGSKRSQIIVSGQGQGI
jgi:hypothetical protein